MLLVWPCLEGAMTSDSNAWVWICQKISTSFWKRGQNEIVSYMPETRMCLGTLLLRLWTLSNRGRTNIALEKQVDHRMPRVTNIDVVAPYIPNTFARTRMMLATKQCCTLWSQVVLICQSRLQGSSSWMPGNIQAQWSLTRKLTAPRRSIVSTNSSKTKTAKCWYRLDSKLPQTKWYHPMYNITYR